MRITFLGTTAANAYPEAFCRCANCQRARALGRPSLRKRSALLVNDDLLIDLGPDVMTAAQMHGRPLTEVRYCLQTHAHADHLDVSHLLSRSPTYGVVGAPRLHLYGSGAPLRVAARRLRRECGANGLLDPEVGKRLNLEVHRVRAFETVVVGPYGVTPFAVNHDPLVELYGVAAEGRSLFYGVDTASLPEETWHAVRRTGQPFDLVILDHTYGPEEDESDHLSARTLIAHAQRMREEGLLAPDGRVFATHFAHEGNPSHPEVSAFAADHGYEVAYDGLTLSV